jgi:CelD/BcsL family acetyltransferase involved in cellulose biosynthesis
MERAEVFFTYEWALAASRSFRESSSPLLFMMYDAEQLCGVASLAIDPLKPTTAFFLSSSTADYCDVLSTTEVRGQLVATLLAELKTLGCRDVILANLPSESATFRELPSAARSCGYYLTSRPSYDCGIVELGDEQQRQTVLQAVTRKQREKRGLKKLSSLGSVRLTHATTPEQATVTVNSVILSQIARFLASGRVSPLVRPDRRAFLKELGEVLARSGWLQISQLELNERPIAWNYGFRFGESLFWYLPTFRLEYEESSPGSCLLRLLVEEACGDSSLQRLDLGLGDESYKERFANARRPTSYVQLSLSATRHAASLSRQKLVAAAALHPRLEKSLHQTRELLRDSVNRIRNLGLISTAGYVSGRLVNSVASDGEILFFEAPEFSDDEAGQLIPLTWDLLSDAALRYSGDTDTLHYLMRCAERLKRAAASGFVMRRPDGSMAHCLWVGEFEGFHLSEINYVLGPSEPGAAMIFDCWTPADSRGRGCYGQAIRMAAGDSRRQKRKAWIFTVASNASSLRGILKAGFVYRYSLRCRTRLGLSKVTRHEQTDSLAKLAEDH